MNDKQAGCRACKRMYSVNTTHFTFSHIGGKTYRSKVCNTCKKNRVGKNTTATGLPKMRNKTIPEQKKLARARDKGCIFPGCTMSAMYCDNDHVFSKPSEILPKGVNRNLHYYCVTLCRYHHGWKKHPTIGATVHEYCQVYLSMHYQNSIEHTPHYDEKTPARFFELGEKLFEYSYMFAPYAHESYAKSDFFDPGKRFGFTDD